MSRKYTLALVTLILLIAAFLRTWQLAVYPPGPHYDEAAELLITRSIAFGGARFFPMVEAYQGREVLFYDLAAPFLSLIHDDIFTLRVLSVFCSLLTIAASIALGRALFSGKRGVVVGVVIGILITLSFPLLWMSRQAFRSSALPLMQALALLLLFRGLKLTAFRRAAPLLLLGGVFAGAAVYTYNSSRLFPFWLLLGGLALLWFDRARWRQRLGQGLVFFGALALTAAPMALYALQRPDVFFGRLAEVTQPDQSITFAQSIVLHLKMFFLEGDPYFRYNEPGRPYFTFPEGILLLLGVGIAAYRLTRRRIPPVERAGYVLALLSPLMVIPSVISVGGLPPSHMRSLGMVPLIFVLVALGAEWGIQRVQRLLRERSGIGVSSRWSIAAVAVLLVGSVLVGDLYFRWAARAELYYESDADLAAAAQWLIDQQYPAGTPIYLAAADKGHPTVMIQPVPPITWIGTDSIFRPPPGQTGVYIFPHSAPPPAEWRGWLAPGALTGIPLAPDGQPAFWAYTLSGDAPLPFATTQAPSIRNPYLTFVALDAPSLAAGASGSLTMAWQVEASPPFTDLTPLLTLEDAHGSLLYRGDAYMAGTESWRPGETLLQRIAVEVPPATPPGEYMLRVAWIERSTDTYVSYLDETGAQGVVWQQIGTLQVTRPAEFPDPASLPIGVGQTAEAAPGVTLLGWDAPPAALRPGETLPLTLYWQAEDDARESFTLRALLRGASGETLLWSGQPVDDRYPAAQWANGELLADRARWRIPRELPPGEYTLLLSFDALEIPVAALSVAGVPRSFEPPEIEQVLDASFADQLQLYGIHPERVGDELRVRLVWLALTAPSQDYKVFVHLVDADGVILSQRDSMPQSDQYPTSLWLPGEFVPDSYTLPFFENAAALRIGLYSPLDGVRLSLLDETGIQQGDYLEIPLE